MVIRNLNLNREKIFFLLKCNNIVKSGAAPAFTVNVNDSVVMTKKSFPDFSRKLKIYSEFFPS